MIHYKHKSVQSSVSSPKFLLLVFLQLLLVLNQCKKTYGFSASPLSSWISDVGEERFHATCPADPNSIRQLEPSLIDNNNNKSEDNKSIWVAVYRSNQNKPSILKTKKSNNRQDFLNAMKIATSEDDMISTTTSSTSSSSSSWSNLLETPMALEKPVAVGQLRPSPDYPNKYLLDSLRCGLKKEEMDDTCDGGSEYNEALSVAVDTLILQHLKTIKQKQKQQKDAADDEEENEEDNNNSSLLFHGTIRTKGTLFSQSIFENRGFQPVEELSKDMATHISNFQACLDSYTQRAKNNNCNENGDEDNDNKKFVVLSPNARDRALQITSYLHELYDKEQEEAASASASTNGNNNGGDDDGYDPWANINIRR